MGKKKALPAFAGKQRTLQYKIQIQFNEIFFTLMDNTIYTTPCAIMA